MKQAVFIFVFILTTIYGNAFAQAFEPLREISEKLNSEWKEKNKSLCGMAGVKALQINNTDDLKNLPKKLLLESAPLGMGAESYIKQESKTLEEFDMAIVLNSLMESYGLDQNSFDQKIVFTKNVQQLLNKLEVNKNTLVITTEIKSNRCQKDQKIKSYIFYKSESEKAFLILTAQGQYSH